FSYSVSHDLRAPLRSIDGFSRILLRDQAAALDAPGREHLSRIRAATQRMATLIDDLLQLSRTARADLRPGPVELAGMARAIAAGLDAGEPARHVAWCIAPELVVTADAALMRIVLENLLGNAWKFTSRRDGAQIEFDAEDRDGERVFFVRDNGAGFDMRYVDKLFGAFQRMHTVDEFPGTGIGLATAQRIILRHGGRVWAEGEPDRGAMFLFTLNPPER
ncbi:MAG TPA: ATP-binding protein, partial [Lacunisphaera sp.]|nr:ATP-binding protein [Lacunisphaera sp.]